MSLKCTSMSSAPTFLLQDLSTLLHCLPNINFQYLWLLSSKIISTKNLPLFWQQGGGGLMNQLRKSYSLSDLTDNHGEPRYRAIGLGSLQEEQDSVDHERAGTIQVWKFWLWPHSFISLHFNVIFPSFRCALHEAVNSTSRSPPRIG